MRPIKYILTLLTLTALTLTAQAQDFRDRELSLQSYYQVQLEDLGHVDQATGDGIGIGATYYHTRNIGLAASALVGEHFDGILDQAAVGLRLRYPLGPVAPYVLADVIYDFRTDAESYLIGGGLEYRFAGHVAVFGEVGRRLDYAGPDLTARVGVGWSF